MDKNDLNRAIAAVKEETALALVAKETPVGAVVLAPDGTIAARSHNETARTGSPLAHAEFLALNQAAENLGGHWLGGYSLIVSLEPCLMCFGAALNVGIGEIYYLARSPLDGAFSKYHLQCKTKEHFLPDDEEAQRLKAFFAHLRHD